MREALAILGDDERDPDVAALWCDLGRALLFTGHAEEAGELFDRSLSAAEALELHDVTCRALDLKAIYMEYLGRFAEARALHEASFEISQRHRVSRGHVALTNLAVLLVTQDMPGAIEACERGLEASRRRGDRSGESLAIGNLMAGWLYAGEWDSSAELAARALAEDLDRPDVEYIHQQHGLLRVFRGELDGARGSASRARRRSLRVPTSRRATPTSPSTACSRSPRMSPSAASSCSPPPPARASRARAPRARTFAWPGRGRSAPRWRSGASTRRAS